jgi:hypothetical protein
MSKAERPPGVSDEAWALYELQHGCLEDHQTAIGTRIDGLGSRISLDWRVNILALAAIMLTLGGLGVGGVVWFSKVDASLGTLTQVVSDQKALELDRASDHATMVQMQSDLKGLQGSADRSETALTGHTRRAGR